LILVLIYMFRFLQQVDISLIYCWQQTIPLPFTSYLHYPGGISDLLAARLLELLALPYWGSIVVALLVVIVFFSLLLIFRRMKDNPLYFTALLLALVPYMILFAHYRLPAGVITGLTAGFLLAALQSLYSPGRSVSRSGYYFIAGVVVYFVAGAPGLIILVQVALIEIVLQKRTLELASVLLPLLIIPLCFMALFDAVYTLKYAYLGAFIIQGYELPGIFYITLCSPLLILLVCYGISSLFSRFVVKNPALVSGTGIIMALVVLFFSLKAGINENERIILSVAKASFDEDWEKVLQLTEGRHVGNRVVQFEINRALYHTGRLLDDMFHYPQEFGEEGLFLEYNYASSVAIHMSKFYSDLGFVTEARHWANEAHIGFMRHPLVLQQLVKTYIAMGNQVIALKYLRILSGSRLYRDWCGRTLKMIEDGKALEDPEIQFYIANNPEIDYFASTKYPTEKLLAFYHCNRDNRMAFEYLIASYLLQHELGKVVNRLQGFRDLDYKKLPDAVEEAMLIYVTKTKEENPKLADFAVNVRKLEEFRDFSRKVLDGKTKREGMEKASEYRNTYWYYVLFTSPHTSQR
jgi:hypothetical protein